VYRTTIGLGPIQASTLIAIHIAQTIKSARQQKGFTQQDLGELIGRTSESLSNIERAKSIPSVETLIALSTALELPVSVFFPELEQNSKASAKRMRMEAEASGIIRSLSDRMLETAIEQLQALAKISS
jgi:transcriptional regulator with XRE-family HTH domain